MVCAVLILIGHSHVLLGSTNTVSSSAAKYADMSLEQLLNESVTSVSKKEQKISEAPAAVYVITEEDVRRSGATSIAEALRMVPGLEVSQVDANKWAITSRGFNGLYADKLLVLVDGRSVYTPLFAGVHWDSQDVVLEDLDRIEVIRGPGATLWGANAVNGVINIRTKSARETQGTLISGGGGSELLGFGTVRYGGKVNDDVHYRAYVKYQNHDDFVDARGRDAADEWDMFRTGFRLDWDPAPDTQLTFQGDYNSGRVHGVFPTNEFNQFQQTSGSEHVTGGNLLARYTRTLSENSSLEIQAYYDRVTREGPVNDEIIDTFDFDAQHRFGLWERNDIVWGIGYRLVSDHNLGGSFAAFHPDSAERQIFSAFAQDEITIVEDRLKLTLGSKIEHNDYSGLEIQPSGRLLYTPDGKNSFWGSVSRAVRTPSRYERDITFGIGSIPASATAPPTILEISGNHDQESEELLAYELGYRAQVTPRVAFDLAGFYNDYDNIRSTEMGTPRFSPTPTPHVIVPLTFGNKMRAETYGAEAAASWRVTDGWKLNAGYTWFRLNLENDGSNSPDASSERINPQHQFHVRSYLDLPKHFQFDAAAYYVDDIRLGGRPGVAGFRISDYVRLDFRLGWQPVKNLDVSVVLQNALDDRHPEAGRSFGVSPTEIQRSIYGKLTWRF